ncbi:MAG: acyl carrier protein [Acidobacteriota bacterium]
MPISPDEAADRIEAFLRREFRVAPEDPPFGRDTHLFEAGFVDSTGVIELVAFLESAFGVDIPDEDLFSEAFTTVNGISGIVHRRADGAPPPGPRPRPE